MSIFVRKKQIDIMPRTIFIILCLLSSLSLTIKGEGLRVLFIGDSITDGGWGNSGGSAKPSDKRNHWDLNHIYGHSYMMLCASHFESLYPGQGYEFFNRGISGDTLKGLAIRCEKDILALRPDVLSILIGTNDVNEYLRQGAIGTFDLKTWESTYRALLDTVRKGNPDVKLMLCTPFVAQTGKLAQSADFPLRDSLVTACAGIVRKIATDYHATLVPFDTLFGKLLCKYPANDGKYWIWDGIHPTPAGHRRMADLWIEQAQSLLVISD